MLLSWWMNNQFTVVSITALPRFTAPLATLPAAPTTAEPAETPTLTAVPATDAAVDATETATQPVEDARTATQVQPRINFIVRINAESGCRSRDDQAWSIKNCVYRIQRRADR
jgi:hypothetical protein